MAEISCSSHRERLPLYTAGQLPSAERARLAAHLATCSDCQRELAFWQSVAGALDLLDDEIPPDTDGATRWQALRRALPARSLLPTPTPRERVHMENRQNLSSSARADGIAASTRASPRRPLLALSAFVLIVALSATLFAVLGSRAHQGQHPTVAATPAVCAPDQLRVNLPPHASIADISMVSPRAGWAVGEIWDPASPATPPKTLIARFHDCQWTALGDSIPTAELVSVSMGSASDGWAVGMTVKAWTNQNADGSTSSQWNGDQAIVLHYTRGAWQRASVPGNRSIIDARVRMFSASAGLMLLHGGKSHPGPDTIAYADTVLRYTNGSWSVLPSFSTNPSTSVADITALSADDGWVAGNQLVGAGNYEYSVLAHYHAGAWTQEATIPGGLSGISFASPTNGWAVGNGFTGSGSGIQAVPLILRYDGARWTPVALPASLRISGAFLTGVTAVSNGEAWAFGSPGPSAGPIADGGSALVLHYANGQWTRISWPFTTVSSPHDMGMYSATQGFAIGDIAEPVGYSYTAQKGVIVLYDHGAWSVLPSQQA